MRKLLKSKLKQEHNLLLEFPFMVLVIRIITQQGTAPLVGFAIIAYYAELQT
jgi:hypothetical protein